MFGFTKSLVDKDTNAREILSAFFVSILYVFRRIGFSLALQHAEPQIESIFDHCTKLDEAKKELQKDSTYIASLSALFDTFISDLPRKNAVLAPNAHSIV